MHRHRTHPLRIVSVDDEEMRLEVVELIVSRYFKGVTVQSFQDPEEAWQELSRTDPDLLITDDIMGKLNGDEIVRRLAERKVAYPIIMITGYGPERDQWVSDYAKRGMDVTLLHAAYSFEGLARAVESGLKIPRDLATPDETKPTKNQTPKPRGKLLTVDDEDSVRQSMHVIFKDEYDVFMAGDGLTAIELAKQNDIDVVVTNISMPGMRGIELLERLKSLKPDIEVIMLTAHATPNLLLQALRVGAFDYITKPFEVVPLRAAISKAMQHRTSSRIRD